MPTATHDDYLGDISNDRFESWRGTRLFNATQSVIEFSFKTGDGRPSQKQTNFVREVEMRFTELWRELRKTLFEGLDDFADGTTMEELFDSLKVEAIDFWDLTCEPYDWEISCTTPLDDHIFGITMSGFEYRGFRMDG